MGVSGCEWGVSGCEWGVVCGVWCVVCGVWCVVCGVWCVVCGVCIHVHMHFTVVCCFCTQEDIANKLREKENSFIARINKVHQVQSPDKA